MTRTSKQTPTPSKPPKLMIFAGMIELMRPLGQFTKWEREQLADRLSGIAADILKEQAGLASIRWTIDVEAEPRPSC